MPDAMNITIQHDNTAHNQSMEVIKTVDSVGLVDESPNNHTSIKKRVKVTLEPKSKHKDGR